MAKTANKVKVAKAAVKVAVKAVSAVPASENSTYFD